MSTEPSVIPFRVGVPIQDPADFVGRRDVLREISSAMLNLQHISLHGERRTGKTSLLLYLAHPVSSTVIGLPGTHIPVYLDFQGLVGASVTDVWQSMADDIVEQIGKRHPDKQAESKQFLAIVAEFLASPRAPESSGTGFGRALTYLGASGFKIHFLFDEFDQTERNPSLGEPFYDALRSLPVRAGNLSYVIATRIGLASLQRSYSRVSSPFFNIFTTMTLTPFNEDEVYDLIFEYFAHAGLDIALAEKLCTESCFLYDVTGYHPYFLQMLCYHMCTNLDKPDWPLGQARQEALRGFARDSEPHFKYYWDVSSEEERALIEELATGQSIDWDILGNAAKSLEDRCLMVPAKSGWQLFSSAFASRVQEFAALYSAGAERLHEQSWEEAGEKARRLEDLQDLYRAGKACLEQNEWEAAVRYLTRIVDSGEEYEDAAALLEEANKQFNLQTLYTEAQAQLEREKWREAINALEKIVCVDQDYRDSYAKLEQARAQDRLQSLYRQALDHLRGERWSQAIGDLEIIRREDSDYLDVVDKLEEAREQQELADLYSAGVGFLETGRWEEAIGRFREIFRRVGVYEDVAERLAKAQRQQRLERLFREGEDYRRQGEWEQAVRAFEAVCAVDPDYPAVQAKLEEAKRQVRLEDLRNRGEAGLRDGNWQAAVEAFEELRQLDPRNATVITKLEEAKRQRELDRLYREGMKHFQKERWRRARSALQKLIDLDSDYRDAAAKLETAEERSARSNLVIELLRDPVCQGIGVVVAIIIAASPFLAQFIRNLPKPTPTPKPATLCNGDFENGFACWQHGGELDQSVECEGNQCYAILGNPDYPCEGGVPVGKAWIKQSFQVPDTISPTLSLQYWVFSYDLDNLDFFQVSIDGEVVGKYGNTEWYESSCDAEAWDSGWQSLEFDLSRYTGKTVEVSLQNANGTYEWWNTWTYVDDVEVR